MVPDYGVGGRLPLCKDAVRAPWDITHRAPTSNISGGLMDGVALAGFRPAGSQALFRHGRNSLPDTNVSRVECRPIVSVVYFLSYVDSENNTYYPKNTSNPTTTIYAGKIWWHASKMPLQAPQGLRR